MKWNEWRQWFKHAPLSLKWFLLVILFRPVIDIFWYLKESNLISPLQITGILTFMFAVFFILVKKTKYYNQPFLLAFLAFGILLIFNSFVAYIDDPITSAFGNIIRTILPVFLVFFIRNEIRNIKDINGILMTFLISSIFPYTILLYETAFSPIRFMEISEGRGGGYRLTGFYADLFNYMSYIIGNLVIFSAYFISMNVSKASMRYFSFLMVLGLTIIGLIGLKHQASWAVFFVVLLLLLIHTIGNRSGKVLISLVFITLFLGGGFFWEQVLAPLYGKEIRAFTGDADQERALNGRIIRWERYFDIWEQMPPYTRYIGVGLEDDDAVQIMMSGGMHSDYVRFLFSTGYIGLTLYMIFFLALFIRSGKYPTPVRFFIRSSIACLLLFSVSSCPFGSSGAFLYLIILGLILGTLPINIFSTKPPSPSAGSRYAKSLNPYFR